jgi:hypothetical protein
MTRAARIALVAVASVVLLTGCATGPGDAARESIAERSYRGLPGQAAVGPAEQPLVTPLGGNRFALTLWGSSSCPRIPTAITTDGSGVLVQLAESGGEVCTADMAAMTHELLSPVPPPFTVTVEFDGIRSEVGTVG